MDVRSAGNQIFSKFLKMCSKTEIYDNVRVRNLTCCHIAHFNHWNKPQNYWKKAPSFFGLLKRFYIIKWCEYDLRALCIIHVNREYMNGSHAINGYQLDDIEMILDFYMLRIR